jgi:hypothetical protein
MSFVPFGNKGSLVSLPEGSKKRRKNVGERYRTSTIPNHFEKIMHMHFKVLKRICSIVLSSN